VAPRCRSGVEGNPSKGVGERRNSDIAGMWGILVGERRSKLDSS